MMRIAQNLLTGGDIGNIPPIISTVFEINEQQYDPIVGRFYRLKGINARTSGSGSFKPVKVGEMVSFGLLVKGDQPHTVRVILFNGATNGLILDRSVQITTDWQWITIEGAALVEVRDVDTVRLFVYPKDFELHWAKASAYIGPPSDIWTPAHADLTPEQIALMKYGEFEEAKQI